MIKQSVLIPFLLPFASSNVEGPDYHKGNHPLLYHHQSGVWYKPNFTSSTVIKYLPIILEDFRTATNIDGRPKLEWRLAAIDEAIQVRVLHSTNNINWHILLTINEAVNGSIKNYEYYPNCVGVNFYKLQIIPASSIVIDSKILPLTCSDVSSNAYPNPAKGYLMVKIPDSNWKLLSADGRLWKVPGQILNNGFVQLDLRNLPLGYYIVVTSDKRIPILHI